MATQLSKNNHTKITYSYIYEKNGVVIEEEVDGPYTYTYKYDGDLLVERTYTSDATSSSTTYYEY
jgi:hypothetical protein